MALRRLVLAALIALVATGAEAQNLKTAKQKEKVLAGPWIGTVAGRAQIKRRLLFKVAKDDAGAYKAVMINLDLSPLEIPVDTVSVDGQKVIFSIKSINGHFEGTRNAAGTMIAGQWTEAPGQVPLPGRVSLRLRPATKADLAGVVVPKELVGLWAGQLNYNDGEKLRIVLRLEPAKQGGPLRAVYDSLDQGLPSIPVTSISLVERGSSSSAKAWAPASPAGSMRRRARSSAVGSKVWRRWR